MSYYSKNASKNKKTFFIVGGWVVSIIVAIVGTFSFNSGSDSSAAKQTANNSVVVNIDGENVTLGAAEAQKLYDDLETKVASADEMLNALQTKIDTLEEENGVLITEKKKYESFGTDALVSKNLNYDADKITLFAFEPVNSNGWTPNEGTLKDSLGTDYTVTLPYIVVGGGGYAEYYTNGNFSKIQGKIAPHENKSNENTVQVKIYADDILVYSSQDINRKTECFEFEADLNDAKFIKIECVVTSGYADSSLLIMDATLVK